jgi:hypothetical protein
MLQNANTLKNDKGPRPCRPYIYYNYYPEMYCQDLHN